MEGKSLDELFVGQKAEYEKTVLEADVVKFGEISGDMNPAHFDEEYAKNSIFKKRIAHGILCTSFFSTILGTILPGPGTIYLAQEVKFLKPVYFGEKVKAVVEIIEIIPEKNRIVCDTTLYNQDGEKVIVGKATVMPPKKA